MNYKERFADQLRRIDYNYGSHHGLELRYDYDAEGARNARIRLVERLRRIEITPPAQLSYEEFLDSPYWVSLSTWLKSAVSHTCEACNHRFYGAKGLDVHHRTYAHLGNEYPDHLDDLEVLCRVCHKRRHAAGTPSQLLPFWESRTARLVQLSQCPTEPAGRADCPQCHGSGYVTTTRQVAIAGIAPYETEFAAVCTCRGGRSGQ